MFNIGTKTNKGGFDDSKTALKLGAGETNSFLSELKNLVEGSGQTLSTNTTQVDPDVLQVIHAVFRHGSGASAMVDSGTANARVLTPFAGLTMVDSYALLNGSEVTFLSGSDNTAATTVDIGQTSPGGLLGPKPVYGLTGAALTGGEIATGRVVQLRYESALDGGSGGWRYMNQSGTVTGDINRAELYFYGQFMGQ